MGPLDSRPRQPLARCNSLMIESGRAKGPASHWAGLLCWRRPACARAICLLNGGESQIEVSRWRACNINHSPSPAQNARSMGPQWAMGAAPTCGRQAPNAIGGRRTTTRPSIAPNEGDLRRRELLATGREAACQGGRGVKHSSLQAAGWLRDDVGRATRRQTKAGSQVFWPGHSRFANGSGLRRRPVCCNCRWRGHGCFVSDRVRSKHFQEHLRNGSQVQWIMQKFINIPCRSPSLCAHNTRAIPGRLSAKRRSVASERKFVVQRSSFVPSHRHWKCEKQEPPLGPRA